MASDSSSSAGDQRADPEGDGGIAVPVVEDRAAVDGHQVAGDELLGVRRDAVHDAVVDRRADRRREPVVAEERRDTAAVADHRFGDPVQFTGGDPGCGGLAGRPCSAAATSAPAAAIASSSPGLR